jgi:UDP-N-acetylmuramoyl-tripeptide--D-alanyl-D-alanine ligase
MIAMTLGEIAKVISGVIHGDIDEQAKLSELTHIHFDSRKIAKGDVFIALLGENADGHDFVDDALKNGAALSIVTKQVPGPHILVQDVLSSLGSLAHHVRNQIPGLKVIGITGSQGKTTTKDMLFSILAAEGESVAAEGSFNNDLGVPLTILRCKETTQFCITEMGARHGGDISALTKIAAPDVGAVLKVGNAHIGEFGSQEKIAATKGELIAGLKSGATAILGTYDRFTPAMPIPSGVKRITFGERHDCTVRAADVEFRGGYAHFDLVTPESREAVELRVIGLHQISNALAAAAIAFALGVSTSHISSALSTHESASKWRMEIHEGCEMLLINDAYNANPESMESALRTLVLLTQERGGRSWAFLGTMHELGIDSPAMHRGIGELAAQLGVDHLVSIGAPDYLDELPSSITTTHYFDTVSETLPLLAELHAGDVILVKASRAEHLEVLAKEIEDLWSAMQSNGNEGENS